MREQELRSALQDCLVVLNGWSPIVQRHLDGLLMMVEAQDGAKGLFESAAWKAANKRVEDMQSAIKKAEEALS